MQAHYIEKYNRNIARPLILPHLPAACGDLQRMLTERPIVLYAGGVQPWQNAAAMAEAVRKTQAKFEFKISTPCVDEMWAIFEQNGVGRGSSADLVIEARGNDAVIQAMKQAHYGFLLRDDININNVSCPTNFVEYLAYGVVPNHVWTARR